MGQRATALATAMHQALKGHGATDYVGAIKADKGRLAAL